MLENRSHAFDAATVPSGGSPDGTGESPVLPTLNTYGDEAVPAPFLKPPFRQLLQLVGPPLWIAGCDKNLPTFVLPAVSAFSACFAV